jgi:hypothetical protein
MTGLPDSPDDIDAVNLCANRFVLRLLLAGIWLGLCPGAPALEYQDNKMLTKQIKDLAKDHKKLVRAETAATTPGKNEVWRLELGAGTDEQRKQRPAMLVVAGIEGNDLAGTTIALAWARSLANSYESDEKAKRLLDSTTIHLWPRLNPDAAKRFFLKPRVESLVNEQPQDDDHDGLLDEDGPDDLDGDGLITWMRIEDPDGEYILDPVDPRLLLKADRTKGERGAWRYLSEGRDNDADRAWNEDGLGGVNFNRNYPFNYRFFASGSGRHQVSEIETRALADFVVEHPNIAVVFTFSAADNLSQTPKGEAPKRPPTALHEDDVAWYREAGKSWRDSLDLKKELTGGNEPGTFSDWMYFHRGRLSLAARPWSPAFQLELGKAKTKEDQGKAKEEKPKENESQKEDKPGSEKAAEKPADKGKETDTRNEQDRAFLKWIEENAKESFVPWKSVDHPDFPGKKVEIGGFAPYARSNPPEKLLDDLAGKQGKFLTELAGKLPRIGVRKTEVKHLGEAVYDVTMQIENSGSLPTTLAQGGLTREVHPTRVVLKAEPKNLLSGKGTTMLNAIQPGEAKEVRWVIRAKGQPKLEVEVISMLGGRVQTSLELKEGQK